MTKLDLLVRYDRDSDVLYVTRRPGRPALSREKSPGVLWRYDVKNNDLIGVTILDFGEYWKPRLNQLAQEMADNFSISKGDALETLMEVQ